MSYYCVNCETLIGNKLAGSSIYGALPDYELCFPCFEWEEEEIESSETGNDIPSLLEKYKSNYNRNG